MKFDFAIGNPPYQDLVEESLNKEFAPPVYNKFLDAAYEIADRVEMIHPARFLYNSGSTPKEWNTKMLNDEHLKVGYFEQDSSKVFANTDIKGGVCITYRDSRVNFGAIEVFTPFQEIRTINEKVWKISKNALSDIIYTQNRFNLDKLYTKYPKYKTIIGSEGKDKRFRNNIFDKIDAFVEDRKQPSDIAVIGVIKNKRNWRYISRDVIDMEHENLTKYKVIVPRANGSGALGETLSSPTVIGPYEGYTQTFIGIGSFATEIEANNALKYLKSKFARCMLSILKNTQHNEKDTWRKVPIQDFTETSDIDWYVSISNIDKQFYKKYGLFENEIDFIETNVKEME